MRRRPTFSLLVLTAAGMALSACAARDLPQRLPFGSEDRGVRPQARDRGFRDIPYASWNDYEPPYRFYPGDEIEVSAPSAPELNKTATVQPDGRISLPLIPAVMAADRTIPELEAALSGAYASQLLRPVLQVSPKAAPLKVFVGGEVGNPGVIDLQGDSDALRAIIQAGGVKTSGDLGKVIILRRGADGRGMMRTVNLGRGLKSPMADLAPLRRFDIVFVPRSGVANAGLFVQQYLRDLQPIQFGFSYSIGKTKP
jgi:protein involved in polysaccharide export with SLBB domain